MARIQEMRSHGLHCDIDAKMWDSNGNLMTVYPIPAKMSPRTNHASYRKRAHAWLDKHTEGEWRSTPSYIAFEYDSDLLLFRLGF